MAETPRSPELLALEKRAQELRNKWTVRAREPSAGGCSIKDFVDLTDEVAEHYEPSGYLKTVPKI